MKKIRLGRLVAGISFLILAACAEPFTIEEMVDGSIDRITANSGAGTTTISPASVDLYLEQILTFDAYGGVQPYTYAVSVNNTGSSMSGSTYTAGVNPGIDTVEVTDSLGDKAQAQVTVSALPLSTSVDYDISSPSFTITSGEPYLAGDLVSGQFDILNSGGNAGGVPIEYNLFASANVNLGPQDYLVASGTHPPLMALASATINFTGGNWPNSTGSYYLILKIEVLDDNNSVNNSWTSAGASYSVQ